MKLALDADPPESLPVDQATVAETVTVSTYGRILGFSRECIVNGDEGAFQDISSRAAKRLAAFLNQVFFDTCFAPNAGLGRTMGGTWTVYNANHGNIGSAGASSTATLV